MEFGLQLVLSLVWFSFFDIGLTQGLRNKFAEAIAKDEYRTRPNLCKYYYAILAIIFCHCWIIFLFVNHFLNWAHILNISEGMPQKFRFWPLLFLPISVFNLF